jgi:hypothetical protein
VKIEFQAWYDANRRGLTRVLRTRIGGGAGVLISRTKRKDCVSWEISQRVIEKVDT